MPPASMALLAQALPPLPYVAQSQTPVEARQAYALGASHNKGAKPQSLFPSGRCKLGSTALPAESVHRHARHPPKMASAHQQWWLLHVLVVIASDQ